ncbi:MAG: 5'-nucleotidase C-terminal domain-containing protein [Candidatus Gastranaerophilales bacterium]
MDNKIQTVTTASPISTNKLTNNKKYSSNTNLLNNYLTKDTFVLSPTKQPSNKSVDVSLFQISDIHGKMTNMERIGAVSKRFDEMNNDKIKLKLATGDILLGSNPNTNKVASDFMNWIGITANAIGNHELDATPEAFAKTIENANYKLLAVNCNIADDCPLVDKINKSTIEEYNGEKFGIIGAAPIDMLERVGTRESTNAIQIDNLDVTIEKIQQEVDKFKEQGINKIILLSHVGLKGDQRIAKETSGVDIILGGHTHNLIKGVEKDKNLFSSKTNEPVLLTQIGKDGEYVGIVNASFDKEGILTKIQNNVIKTFNFDRRLPIRAAVESIVGKPEILGVINSAPPVPKDRLLSNNPHGNFIVDAMKNALDTDVAILNAGNVRGFFVNGEIDARRVNDITPFEDKMMICELSEKQIVDAIKIGGKSFEKTSHKPGILLVSGLNYTITDKGELLDLTFINKNGEKSKIDINNPSETRKLTVACDDYFAYGGDFYLPVNENPDYIVKELGVDKNVYTANYIRNHNGPIKIKEDNRVQIVKSQS